MSRLKSMVEPLRRRLRPALIVIGAQKGGTSALFSMLCRHPKVIAPEEKEVTFFSDDEAYVRGIDHYWQQFPVRPVRGSGWLTLDATPGYLSHPLAAERIAWHLPDVQLAVILRDPVKRAFSDWNMFTQFRGHPKYDHLYDPRTFEQAVQDERAGKGPSRYLERGHYAEQLARYFKHFERRQLMVFTYPQFKNDPEQVIALIGDAVGLEGTLPGADAKRVRNNVRSYSSTLSEAMKERLREYYSPHHRSLEELLGHELDLQE